jgi:hypothetical protein
MTRFPDFFYPMKDIGTDAVRCAVCGSASVRQDFSAKRVHVETDTNFKPFYDYASAPGARLISTRMEYRDLVATQRAKGIEVGGDYAGRRDGVVFREHDKIDKRGPAEARRQRAAWQRDHGAVNPEKRS